MTHPLLLFDNISTTIIVFNNATGWCYREGHQVTKINRVLHLRVMNVHSELGNIQSDHVHSQDLWAN